MIGLIIITALSVFAIGFIVGAEFAAWRHGKRLPPKPSRMKETPIQVDGKLVCVAPGEIIKAVCVPGKLVNLLTEEQTAAFCQCWFCLNTGPNGECENCGKPPSPERMREL